MFIFLLPLSAEMGFDAVCCVLGCEQFSTTLKVHTLVIGIYAYIQVCNIHVYVRFILKRTHSGGLPRQREPFPLFSWSLNSFSTHPQAAYDTGAPVFLFFSVNGSSQALALRVAFKNIRFKAEVIQSTKQGFHPRGS